MTVVIDSKHLQALVDGAVILASLHANDEDAVGEIAREVLSMFQPERRVDFHPAPIRKQ